MRLLNLVDLQERFVHFQQRKRNFIQIQAVDDGRQRRNEEKILVLITVQVEFSSLQ